VPDEVIAEFSEFKLKRTAFKYITYKIEGSSVVAAERIEKTVAFEVRRGRGPIVHTRRPPKPPPAAQPHPRPHHPAPPPVSAATHPQDFLGTLSEDECRFIVMDHEYKTNDGRDADKVVFISWWVRGACVGGIWMVLAWRWNPASERFCPRPSPSPEVASQHHPQCSLPPGSLTPAR